MWPGGNIAWLFYYLPETSDQGDHPPYIVGVVGRLALHMGTVVPGTYVRRLALYALLIVSSLLG